MLLKPVRVLGLLFVSLVILISCYSIDASALTVDLSKESAQASYSNIDELILCNGTATKKVEVSNVKRVVVRNFKSTPGVSFNATYYGGLTLAITGSLSELVIENSYVFFPNSFTVNGAVTATNSWLGFQGKSAGNIAPASINDMSNKALPAISLPTSAPSTYNLTCNLLRLTNCRIGTCNSQFYSLHETGTYSFSGYSSRHSSYSGVGLSTVKVTNDAIITDCILGMPEYYGSCGWETTYGRRTYCSRAPHKGLSFLAISAKSINLCGLNSNTNPVAYFSTVALNDCTIGDTVCYGSTTIEASTCGKLTIGGEAEIKSSSFAGAQFNGPTTLTSCNSTANIVFPASARGSVINSGNYQGSPACNGSAYVTVHKGTFTDSGASKSSFMIGDDSESTSTTGTNSTVTTVKLSNPPVIISSDNPDN